MMDSFFLFHFPLGLGKGHTQHKRQSCKNDACQIPTNRRQTNKKIKKKHKLKLKTVANQQQLHEEGEKEGNQLEFSQFWENDGVVK
jgi:hypothetical protein